MADPAGTQGLNYAALVNSNPYTSIAQLIAQKQRQIAETNPYLLGATAMPDIQFNPNQEGSDVAQGVQGILKGLLAGYGIKNARQEQADYAQGLTNALGSSGGVGTLAVDPRYSDIAAQLALEDRQGDRQLQRQLVLNDAENKLAIAKAKELGPIQTEQAIAQAKALAPVQTQQAVDQATALLPAQKELETLKNALNPNSSLISQQQTAAKNQNIEAFIDQKFNKASEISSITASIPFSPASKELKGIGIALTTALQAALGREMNAKEQERVQALTPVISDTEGVLATKREAFKSLMRSIAQPTPLIYQLGADSIMPASTNQTSGQPSAEQARALLKARGVAGY